MKDANGNEMELRGDYLIVRVPVHSVSKAVRYPNGKITTITDNAFDTWDRESLTRTFGTDTVIGESSVVIDLKRIRSLAFSAARNKSKKSQEGAARAAFLGNRTFEPEVKS